MTVLPIFPTRFPLPPLELIQVGVAMVRGKPPSGPSAESRRIKLSSAERSSYFARREAAKILRRVLEGDSSRRAVGTIKSLVYSPTVRNKKATFALVCETLKYLPIIRNVLENARVLNGKWKRQLELVYIVTYDVLFGQAKLMVGDPEKFLILRKDALQSALQKFLMKKKVKSADDLAAFHQTPDVLKPRYVRVNTLKLDVESAILQLGKHAKVQKDGLVPDLLMLPPNTDLHDHPLIMNGSVFMQVRPLVVNFMVFLKENLGCSCSSLSLWIMMLFVCIRMHMYAFQGKASSMVAAALGPEPDWEVLDACSAPGNKTVHLAALMGGNGKIIACELNEQRLTRLRQTINLSGASNIEVLHGDFLKLNPRDLPYSKIRAILLDPSCSGSGTTANRLDHLLPSYDANTQDAERLNKLASFQKKALAHALSFPAVERVVYSTCSIHQIENEDVVASILPLATSLGFQLAAPFPKWNRRGLPVFSGSEYLLRTDPVEDKEGFFIALFIRKDPEIKEESPPEEITHVKTRRKKQRRNASISCLTRLSKMNLYRFF
ncbi:hypothetical protein SAY86_028012 [Trapa natans]|uniref:SAM-dependent MTase RsmB/NOP-type domain-containing protein n=1 Tax=Trapa natans TaxID=22666 RepID=A0AAN7LYL6_TRANT|nr:hypothetical protein SAY86_028012 [Trapa natans]